MNPLEAPAQIDTGCGSLSGTLISRAGGLLVREHACVTRSEARGEATDLPAEAITGRLGRKAVNRKMQAHIVSIEAGSH